MGPPSDQMAAETQDELQVTAREPERIALVKGDFSELQQRIFETENELERIEQRFYTIVSRRAIEL